ncbi:putative RNA-directed DNA polymerase from transposon BS [Amphibalanus amphitrite]|uniref:Putative RNA-directed DNA polymerase from transposon BS n=1 Tax=Amphibalanus amphitrite TaxID=1232801 RepID=A0A6A4W644_AMPAM|nr:putative RNA-directed DNA polymerase from transposon BS [Amphibalanus amphitrite]
MIPPEQVGFREKRGVEDVVARLTQQVQDGWQLKPCPPSRRQVPDGEAAQKYVLVAYDFSRAYDRVDHRLLRARLAELGIPACYNTWVWAFLRDRRACVEVNGTKSGERVYRAGLPQGSVLSPTLFLLWSAPLVATLKTLPGTTPFMFADDTSTLCAGNSIAVARDRAQLAANTLVKWARRSKMEVAGQKTQLLVLSQNPRDAVDCHIHVAGQLVEGGPELKLLGVTLDRTLSFGPHCRSLRRRVRPRAAQLRRLTGRSWGLQEQQLRAVANGYVRGAIEHAAAAWLPAVSKSNIEILEREMRAVARIVTGCIHSAPHHGVTAEAGMLPVAARRTALAARMFAKAAALPPEDPLRVVAMADPPQRLKLVTGWRQVGREALRELRVELPVEALLPERPPPWTPTGKITFNLSIGALPAGAARELHLNHNLLRLLPYELGKLFNLQVLGLKGNPLAADILSVYQEANGTQRLLTMMLNSLEVWVCGGEREWQGCEQEVRHTCEMNHGYGTRHPGRAGGYLNHGGHNHGQHGHHGGHVQHGQHGGPGAHHGAFPARRQFGAARGRRPRPADLNWASPGPPLGPPGPSGHLGPGGAPPGSHAAGAGPMGPREAYCGGGGGASSGSDPAELSQVIPRIIKPRKRRKKEKKPKIPRMAAAAEERSGAVVPAGRWERRPSSLGTDTQSSSESALSAFGSEWYLPGEQLDALCAELTAFRLRRQLTPPELALTPPDSPGAAAGWRQLGGLRRSRSEPAHRAPLDDRRAFSCPSSLEFREAPPD